MATSETIGTETWDYTYNGLGLVTQVAEPSGRTRTLDWWGRGLLKKNTYGADEWSYGYDGGGALTYATHGTSTWSYDHGPRGELRSVTQPGAIGVFTYDHDALARLTGITPPAGGMPGQKFEYDALGRETKRTRGSATWTTSWADWTGTTAGPDGTRVRLLDGRGRIARVTWSGGTEAGLTKAEYGYDALDQSLWVKEAGAGAEDVTLHYDGRSRLESIERAGSPTVAYAYTTSGKLSRVTVGARSVSYDYDGNGHVSTVTGPAGITSVEWEPGGALPLAIRDGALYQRRCYDTAGRLKELLNATSQVSCGDMGPAIVAGFHYTYGDGRGNRTSELAFGQGASSETIQYGYDAADRLTGVQYRDRAVVYQLAADGTRLAEKEAPTAALLGGGGFDALNEPTSHREYRYSASGGLASVTELAGAAPVALSTYELDGAGRPTRETTASGTKTYGWDTAGRLARVGVSPAAGSSYEVTYGYDHAGLRRWKDGPGGRATWLWGAGGLVEETAPGGAAVTYTRVGELTIAAGGERLMHDGLGSVVGRIGAGEPVLYRYDAWGGARGAELPGGGGGTLAYAGQHWDADVGLSYAQQRWYEPGTGRFLSEDPVFGDPIRPDSLNAFAYAGGNPLTFVDPVGRAHYVPGLWSSVPDDDEQDLAVLMKGRGVSGLSPTAVMYWDAYEAAKGSADESRRYKAFLKQLDSEDFNQSFNARVGGATFVAGGGLALGPLIGAVPVIGKVLIGIGTFFSAKQGAEVVTGEKTNLTDLLPGRTLHIEKYEKCGNLMTCDRLWDGVSAGSGLFLSFAASGSVSRQTGNGRIFTRNAPERAATWLEGQLNREIEVLAPGDLNSGVPFPFKLVPPRVQSRINLRNGDIKKGWRHVLNRHFDSSKNASQFTITEQELRQLLQSADVVATRISRVVESEDGPGFVRDVVLPKPVGRDKYDGFRLTDKMTVITDEEGNLVTATPGVIK